MIKLQGQSIVETVIASALISMAILAALSLSLNSQKASTYAKNSAEATKYTSQASDWLRTERNSLGWSTLAAAPGTYCLNTIPSAPNDFTNLSLGNCAADTYIPQTIFTRQITVDSSTAASGTIKITITLSWQETTLHSTSLEMELSQW